jgi:hypothetical protein
MSPEPLTAQRLLFTLAGGELPGWDDFATSVQRRCVPRGARVFEQGVAHPFVYVVSRGLIKLVYQSTDGDAWVKSFIAAGQFLPAFRR